MPSRSTIDLLLKTLGGIAALFAIWQYFSDAAAAKQLEARRQALSYVQAYGDADLRAIRQTMFDFWYSHSDFVTNSKVEGVQQSAYRAFLLTALENDKGAKPMLGAIYAVSNFYDQMAFCRESGVCERRIIDMYFCRGAKAFSDTYGPIAEDLEKVSGADFGRGAKKIAESCDEPDRNS